MAYGWYVAITANLIALTIYAQVVARSYQSCDQVTIAQPDGASMAPLSIRGETGPWWRDPYGSPV